MTTPTRGVRLPKPITWAWGRVPKLGKPGSVIISTGFMSRIYEAHLRLNGMLLLWDNGDDKKAYVVTYPRIDRPAECSCPDFTHHIKAGQREPKCKHIRTVLSLLHKQS